MGAEGQLVAHQFDGGGIGKIEIASGNAAYSIPISKNNGLQVWVYNTDASIHRLLRVGAAERHELIDVTDLPVVDREISVPIGVVIEAADRSIIQLLLADTHARLNGDNVDDASFRYAVYPPGTTQIRALRNGS